MAAAERTLLGIIGHVEQLAREFAGRADIDERLAGSGVFEHLVAESADRKVGILGMIFGRRIARFGITDERLAVEFPSLAAAVHDHAFLVAVELEDPKGIASPPIVLIAVVDDRRVIGDPL